jgi:hypothetical protein
VPGLGPVGLEEAEPDFADGGKQETASQSQLIGTWPTTGNGGRVDEFFHAGADEGDAEQVAAIVVDDHAGAASAAVGVKAGQRHRLAGVDVDHADAVPGAFGLVGGEPDGPGGGSQKNTRGTA